MRKAAAWLPVQFGAVFDLARSVGLSQSHLSRVLNGLSISLRNPTHSPREPP